MSAIVVRIKTPLGHILRCTAKEILTWDEVGRDGQVTHFDVVAADEPTPEADK